MCKVFAMPGIKKSKQKEAKKLFEKMGPIMSKSPDNDGIGYAAITKKGEIYGEKWLNVDDFMKIHENPLPPEPTKADNFMGAFYKDVVKDYKEEKGEKDQVYDWFGNPLNKDLHDDTVAVILHARKTTIGHNSIENTHPFFEAGDEEHCKSDVALIHNGTIRNHANFTKKYSTCDSEILMHMYNDYALAYSPESVSLIAKDVIGEYAVCVLSNAYDMDKDECKPVLDVFKAYKDLYCAYVNELETVVFCTSDTMLKNGAKEAGLTLEHIHKLKDGYLLRIDALDGTPMIDHVEFTPGEQWTTTSNTRSNTSSYLCDRRSTSSNNSSSHSNVRNLNQGKLPSGGTRETQRDFGLGSDFLGISEQKDAFEKDWFEYENYISDSLSADDIEKLAEYDVEDYKDGIKAKAYVLAKSAMEIRDKVV